MSIQTETQSDDAGSSELEFVFEAIKNGATIKDLQGVSDEFMEGIYAYAYDFYQKGRLNEAETFFRFLCIYDFYNVDYLIGLAAVYQLKKNYEKAMNLYAVAFAMAKDDYRPMLFTGQCLLYLGKVGKARKCFKTVLKNSQDELILNKTKAYLETIDQVLKKNSRNREKEIGHQQQSTKPPVSAGDTARQQPAG